MISYYLSYRKYIVICLPFGSLFSPGSGALLLGMNGLLPVDEIRFRVDVPAVDSLKMPRTTALSLEMAILLPVPVAAGALLSGKEVLLVVNEKRLRLDALVVDSLKVFGATVRPNSKRDNSLLVDELRVNFDVVVVTDFLSICHQ